MKPVEKLYYRAVTSLLNVTTTTCNELCLNELGLPKLGDIVKQRQKEFLTKTTMARKDLNDDPLMFTLELVAR